jgi:ribosome biogenesis GTPase / thiamine phosphate phosphatase
LQGAFMDIETISEGCHFKDCKHEKEPGCAVRIALEEGLLPLERLDSYKKLQKELVYLESKQNQAVRLI